MKKSILIFMDYYLPGYKAGGPLQTIANMVQSIGDVYDFKIVTQDHDANEFKTYPNILYKEWMQVGKGRVRYLSADEISFKTYKEILDENEFSLVYFQSFFNPKFTLLPSLALFFNKKRNTPILLAPRGEFAEGALNHKKAKKKVFLFFFKLFFQRFLQYSFHCSSEDEKLNTERNLGDKFHYFCALDFNAQKHIKQEEIKVSADKTLHLAFLSRLDPKKNLDFAITVLKNIKRPVVYDIYGNIYDLKYVQKCRKMIEILPKNVTVEMKGELPHPEVLKTLASYDLFFFPTKNENFGHVIHEALLAGVPVLISDQTPWHELNQRHAGWECPLEKPELFAERIEEYAQMGMEQRLAMHHAALQYGIDVSLDQRVVKDNIAMFNFFNK